MLPVTNRDLFVWLLSVYQCGNLTYLSKLPQASCLYVFLDHCSVWNPFVSHPTDV